MLGSRIKRILQSVYMDFYYNVRLLTSTAALDFAFTGTVTRCFGAFTLVSTATVPVRRARVTTHAFSR